MNRERSREKSSTEFENGMYVFKKQLNTYACVKQSGLWQKSVYTMETFNKIFELESGIWIFSTLHNRLCDWISFYCTYLSFTLTKTFEITWYEKCRFWNFLQFRVHLARYNIFAHHFYDDFSQFSVRILIAC